MVTLPLSIGYAFVAIPVAAVAAAGVGAPALRVARSLGLRGFWQTLLLGGLVPAATCLFWSNIFTWCAVVIGTASGGIYATVFDQMAMSPRQVRSRVLMIVAIAVALPPLALLVRARLIQL